MEYLQGVLFPLQIKYIFVFEFFGNTQSSCFQLWKKSQKHGKMHHNSSEKLLWKQTFQAATIPRNIHELLEGLHRVKENIIHSAFRWYIPTLELLVMHSDFPGALTSFITISGMPAARWWVWGFHFKLNEQKYHNSQCHGRTQLLLEFLFCGWHYSIYSAHQILVEMPHHCVPVC